MEKRIVRILLAAAAAAALTVPVAGRGDVVRLDDGSTLKGRVVAMVEDTLTIDTGFGARLRVPRARIIFISFTDTLAVPVPPAREMPAAAPATGAGRVAVSFDGNEVSSKIAVVRGRNEGELLRANGIEVQLFADERLVYSAVDSTMDKTIYNGPERIYRNDAELEDFEVELPAGLHHLALVVRNVGADDHERAFDNQPLNLRLALDNIQVVPERSVRVKVAIKKGLLGMGSPELKRVE